MTQDIFEPLWDAQNHSSRVYKALWTARNRATVARRQVEQSEYLLTVGVITDDELREAKQTADREDDRCRELEAEYQHAQDEKIRVHGQVARQFVASFDAQRAELRTRLRSTLASVASALALEYATHTSDQNRLMEMLYLMAEDIGEDDLAVVFEAKPTADADRVEYFGVSDGQTTAVLLDPSDWAEIETEFTDATRAAISSTFAEWHLPGPWFGELSDPQ